MDGKIILYTGDGKGKTSAALGAATRMLGKGGRVAIVQFMKGTMPSSETAFFEKLKDSVMHVCTGGGFFTDESQRSEQEYFASVGFEAAQKALKSNTFELLILDEICLVLAYNFLPLDTVIELINVRGKTHIILTGRNAPKALYSVAHIVSVIQNEKHIYDAGGEAIVGIDM